jgi:tRNA U34 5-methylaminomethyl-2-thiouridine-forming methyltransferase MnmC
LERKGIDCLYHSIEKFPLRKEILNQLNYGEILQSKDLFSKIINAEWDKKVKVGKGRFLLKEKVDLLEFQSETRYDIILFDAFSPDKQANLWTEEVFRNIYKYTKPRGILTTYSAKGQVRRNMQTVGYQVERIPGPKGKREMLRATKS